ncbi:ras-like GTP-binding protein rhoA [Haliotis cracherodii]|uniref:ras-like GTP-binding protein rhoA n=1 Tax=Haliotis cracherodii TaxID=6455 RepID=UPI0039E74A54
MFRCVKPSEVEEGHSIIRKKLVVVGDGECGKTCLLYRFNKGVFHTNGYLPTVFDSDVTEVLYKNKTVELSLFDTAGQEDYDRLRPICYPDSDVILVCFSVDNPDSLQNVEHTWVPEVRDFCGNVPIILVGTKSDLREDYENANVTCIKQGPVKYREGMAMAARIGAVGYLECSSKTDEGVRQVFENAITASMTSKKSRKLFRRFRKRGN